MSMKIITCPIDDGAQHPTHKGVGKGCEALSPLLGYPVEEIPEPPSGTILERITLWSYLIQYVGYVTLLAGDVPIFVGGDHSLSIGSVSGVAQYWADRDVPFYTLWLDAHCDYNTPEISLTSHVHGMSLATLCRENTHPSLRMFGCMEPENVMIFGARDIDPLEGVLLEMRGIPVTSCHMALRRWLRMIQEKGGVLHVSLDVDWINPEEMPGVGTPAPGGPFMDEALWLLDAIKDSGLVRSLDVVEHNPNHDSCSISAIHASRLVKKLV
jgi:arginase